MTLLCTEDGDDYLDFQMIRKTLETLKPCGLVEIRSVGKPVYSGYFKNFENLLNSLQKYPNECFYFVMNGIKDGCYSREQCEKLISGPKNTTSDNDIERREWILIDADPIRAAGVSSTDEEKAKAWSALDRVYQYLREQGFTEPVIADSGNGYHLIYRVDMENTPESRTLVEGFLKALDMLFSDSVVEIDTSVYNAARITKLYGVIARKGANTPERPHRQSRLLNVPDEMFVNGAELLQKVVDVLPKHGRISSNNSSQRFDIDDFIARHGVRVANKGKCSVGTKYVLEECVFDANHKAPDAAILVLDNGAIAYHCFHNACQGKRWQDVRLMFEPEAYDERQNKSQSAQGNADRRQEKSSKSTYTDCTNANGVCQSQWQEPIPLETYSVPPFPIECLPPILQNFCKGVSESVQVAIDMPAVAVLGVMASCCQKKFRITGKSDWSEPLNLFCVIVGQPAERKSAVFSLVSAPILEYEQNWNSKMDGIIRQNQLEKNLLNREIEGILKAISSRGKKDEDKSGLRNELKMKQEELTNFKEIKPLQLLADDTTPEALVSLLAQNNGQISVFSAEGTLFEILAGRYSKGANVETILKSHPGDMIRVNRIGRAAEYILQAASTILLFVQPQVIKGIMNNEIFRNRGLCARFLYSMPESMIGKRILKDAPEMSPFETDDYKDLCTRLLSIEQGKEAQILTLSDEALDLIDAFFLESEKRLLEDLFKFQDFGGKLTGTILRIAGLLHIAGENAGLKVSAETMEKAISIGRYFLDHAKIAFQVMGRDEDIRDAGYVLEKIKKTGKEKITSKDLLRKCRRFNKMEELQPALRILDRNGYIKANDSATLFFLNPVLQTTTA